MALPEGTRVYVAYDVPAPILYHERYVLAACGCGRGYHIVLTPDFDVYAEQFSPENDDILHFRIADGLQLPAGCNDANTYRFGALPDAAMMQQLRRDAVHAAAAMGGPVAPVVAQAPVAPAGGGAGGNANDEVWVRVETDGDHGRGEVIAMDGSEVVHGKHALKTEGGKTIFVKQMRRSEIDKYKRAVKQAEMRGCSP